MGRRNQPPFEPTGNYDPHHHLVGLTAQGKRSIDAIRAIGRDEDPYLEMARVLAGAGVTLEQVMSMARANALGPDAYQAHGHTRQRAFYEHAAETPVMATGYEAGWNDAGEHLGLLKPGNTGDTPQV